MVGAMKHTGAKEEAAMRIYCSITRGPMSCHAEPKAKHLAFAEEISAFEGQILRCAQNDIHHLMCERPL